MASGLRWSSSVGVRKSGGVVVSMGRRWCDCVQSTVSKGTAEVVIDGVTNHPLDLRGWLHRPHIPTRGEEARARLRSSSVSTRVPAIVVNRPDVGGAGTSSNVRRVPVILPVGGVEASSYRIII